MNIQYGGSFKQEFSARMVYLLSLLLLRYTTLAWKPSNSSVHIYL